MNIISRQGTPIFLALSILTSWATPHYVDLNSAAATPPFTDWGTAATNIQDAIDVASDGDTVFVTNGIYAVGGKVMAGDLTNRVALNKAITVQSVNGPFVTVIQGAGATNGTTAVRCAWLTNGALLVGFTLQGGATRNVGTLATLTSGGGVWCASSNALVANCLIVSNTAYYQGGGVFQGRVNNSLISSNGLPVSQLGGLGGAAYGAILNSCTVVSNTGYAVYSTLLTNCIVYYNGINYYPYQANLFSYSCTTPTPGGTGNFTAAPQFFTDGVHLAIGSPCIGTGTNLVTGTDFFGQAWANPPSVGCAEQQPSPLVAPARIQLTSAPIGFVARVASISGQLPLTYFWLKNGTAIQDDGHYGSSQTTNLVVAGINFADAGGYQLVVSNASGVVTSAVAQLVIHCVDVAGITPVAPYSTWVSAATNIQDAINLAAAGDIVLVTNGIYATGGKVMAGDLTNRVALDKAVTVTSVNGYLATVIQGAWDASSTNGPVAVRCAWLADGAVLSGFTLTQGATRATGNTTTLRSGGGAWCVSTNGVVANCQLTNNAADYHGGGIAYGTLNNSLLVYNLAAYGGGAAYATLNNCTVANNGTIFSGINRGAGTYTCVVRNSIVLGNTDGWPSGITEDNYYYDISYSGPKYSYSCTYPLPSGTGNMNGHSLNPQFLDLFHIAATSPCRGVGSVLYATGADLEGELWANPPSMGCDEVIPANLVGPLTVSLLTYQTNLLVNRPGWFTGILTGRAARVEWSFADGPTVTNAGAVKYHQWTNAGDYTVTFTAINNDNPAGVATNVLVHVLPLSVPQLQSALLLTNGFQFQFAGQLSANYTVQYTTNLAPPAAWQTLQNIYFSNGGVHQVTDAAAPIGTRFYRVLAQ